MTKEVALALEQCKNRFMNVEETALYNQKKVLTAFSNSQIALRHFNGTSGYGNDDVGRDGLNRVVAEIFGADDAVVSPLITSGTHALTLALFGALRPGDAVLSVCGEPYDTLHDVIYGKNIGSLAEFGIQFHCIPLKNNDFDFDAIQSFLQNNKVKMVYLQRSRGYAWRAALSIAQIEKICAFVKKIAPQTVIFCDNCYGEFVEKLEPTQVGVDYCAGSFIKNIGGGIAPTGGYVVGRKDLIQLVAGRLTSPSIGTEVGSYAYGYRMFYQGIFNAPHTVSQALKTSILFAQALTNRGYEVSPGLNENVGDIVCSIRLGSAEKMVSFCQSIQAVSPIDAFVSPEPWEQPGYADKVIMAAGCFVQGASIELSCDGPIRPPYVVYLQGGLTFEHGIIALEKVLESL